MFELDPFLESYRDENFLIIYRYINIFTIDIYQLKILKYSNLPIAVLH